MLTQSSNLKHRITELQYILAGTIGKPRQRITEEIENLQCDLATIAARALIIPAIQTLIYCATNMKHIR